MIGFGGFGVAVGWVGLLWYAGWCAGWWFVCFFYCVVWVLRRCGAAGVWMRLGGGWVSVVVVVFLCLVGVLVVRVVMWWLGFGV